MSINGTLNCRPATYDDFDVFIKRNLFLQQVGIPVVEIVVAVNNDTLDHAKTGDNALFSFTDGQRYFG